MAQEKTALVVGATGIAGGALIMELAQRTDFKILAMSRGDALKAPLLQHLGDRVTPVRADLFDADSIRKALAPHRVTHVFYAASKFSSGGDAVWPRTLRGQTFIRRVGKVWEKLTPLCALFGDRYFDMINHLGGIGALDENSAMFNNVLSAVTDGAHVLQHLVLVTGGRYYGHHLGTSRWHNFQENFVEDKTPRPPGTTNWYHAVEDRLTEEAQARGFAWSILRPSTLVGPSIASGFNVGVGIAAYANILRHLGQPLHFPGALDNWLNRANFTDSELLARMMCWVVDNPAAQNQAFNCTNDGVSSWSEVWPKIAESLGMKPAHSDWGLCVEELLVSKPGIWDEIVETYGLENFKVRDLCGSTVLDRSCAVDTHAVYSMEKARRFGFNAGNDPSAGFLRLFALLQKDRVIPPPKTTREPPMVSQARPNSQKSASVFELSKPAAREQGIFASLVVLACFLVWAPGLFLL